VQVCLFLRRALGMSSLQTLSELVVVLLKGNVEVFSPVCDPEFGIAEYVRAGKIEVLLVKTG